MRFTKLRIRQKILFTLERQLVKGAHYQLLLVAALIGILSLVGGLLVMPSGPPTSRLGESVWWAFLRLSDPGYLGDDQGGWRRLISTLITVAGYVVFLGSLVAIITTWMNRKIRDLEQGLTHVTANNHLLILGWSNRTIHIAAEIFQSVGRIKRFLLRFGTSKLQVIILSEEVGPFQMQELKDHPMIGSRASEIVLRTGSAIDREHLRRVDSLNASAIIVPSLAYGRRELINPDIETIKCLLSLNAEASRYPGHKLPYVVAEIQDEFKVAAAYRSYSGPLEVVGSNTILSRLMAQNIRHPGLSEVYNEILSQIVNNNLFCQQFPELVGFTIGSLKKAFTKAVILGVVRNPKGESTRVPDLNLPENHLLASEERLVVLAKSSADLVWNSDLLSREPIDSLTQTPLPVEEPAETIRVLILGWNEHVPSLIKELCSYEEESYFVRLVALRPLNEREKELQFLNEPQKRVTLEHVIADYIRESEILRTEAGSFDHIVMVSSDRMEEEEEADARTMVGYVLLEEVLDKAPKRPSVLLELADPSNESLIRRFQAEVIISPMVLSHLLAGIALQRDLNSIYNELFTVGGAEIIFREPAAYGISPGEISFQEIESLAAVHGETVLGLALDPLLHRTNSLLLNPEKKQKRPLTENDRLVVLTTVY
ncbi:CASTOR/POLLUX-related putative ion channel [Cyclobacterium xiamenense]|uniref:CASTOR/POLLUX-related putative ion channel n=1 Tax=Cyclobacterium xiamenense TaxID=1297121 RepID=UPI0012B8A507|nr:ion channel DMI1 [Cyclobacterium xiamenense]